MIVINLKLFKELKRASDQQNEFHVEKMSVNSLKLMSEIYELEDKGLIELKKNIFTEKHNMLAVEAKGKIKKQFRVIHTS